MSTTSELLKALGYGGATLGAGAAIHGVGLGDLLSPLDYPRRALYNTFASPIRALESGNYSDLLGAIPGLAGGVLGGVVGGPVGVLAGSALGGALQGIGQSTGRPEFNAPSVSDITGTEDFLPNLAVGMATDPLTYAGLGATWGAGKSAVSASRAARAAKQATPMGELATAGREAAEMVVPAARSAEEVAPLTKATEQAISVPHPHDVMAHNKLARVTESEMRVRSPEGIGPYGFSDFSSERQWVLKDHLESLHPNATDKEIEDMAESILLKERNRGEWAVMVNSRHHSGGVYSWHPSESSAFSEAMKLKQRHEYSGIDVNVAHKPLLGDEVTPAVQSVSPQVSPPAHLESPVTTPSVPVAKIAPSLPKGFDVRPVPNPQAVTGQSYAVFRGDKPIKQGFASEEQAATYLEAMAKKQGKTKTLPSEPVSESSTVPMAERIAPEMYSRLGRAIEQLPDRPIRIDQVEKALTKASAKGEGFNPEELGVTGMDKMLAGKGPNTTVTKQELLDHFNKNKVELQVKVRRETNQNYIDYAVPGGTNHRHMLIKGPARELPEGWSVHQQNGKYSAYSSDGQGTTQFVTEQQAKDAAWHHHTKTAFDEHWRDDPGVIVHLGLDDRVGPNGEKLLGVNEVQSTMHQDMGKRGLQGLPLEERLAMTRREGELRKEIVGLQKQYESATGPSLKPEQSNAWLAKISNDLRNFKDQNGNPLPQTFVESMMESATNPQFGPGSQYFNSHLEALRSFGGDSLAKELSLAGVSKKQMLANKINDLGTELLQYDGKFNPAEMPLKEDWHRVGMEQAIRYASAHGYDGIVVPPGEAVKAATGGKITGQLAHYGSVRPAGAVGADLLESAIDKIPKGNSMRSLHYPTKGEVAGALAEMRITESEANLINNSREYVKNPVGASPSEQHGQRVIDEAVLPNWMKKYAQKHGVSVSVMETGPSEKLLAALRKQRDELMRRLGIGGKGEAEIHQQLQAVNDSIDKQSAVLHVAREIMKDSPIIPMHHIPITPSMKKEAMTKGFRFMGLGGPAGAVGTAGLLAALQGREG